MISLESQQKYWHPHFSEKKKEGKVYFFTDFPLIGNTLGQILCIKSLLISFPQSNKTNISNSLDTTSYYYSQVSKLVYFSIVEILLTQVHPS